MPRLKEKIKILHKPTTHEIFVCLSDMVTYSRLLLEYGPPKPYRDFLKWVIVMNFYKTEGRINIKKISADFKTDTSKITKWISQGQQLQEMKIVFNRLIYGAMRPLAQPRNLIGGHLLSALVGVTVYKIYPTSFG